MGLPKFLVGDFVHRFPDLWSSTRYFQSDEIFIKQMSVTRSQPCHGMYSVVIWVLGPHLMKTWLAAEYIARDGAMERADAIFLPDILRARTVMLKLWISGFKPSLMNSASGG